MSTDARVFSHSARIVQPGPVLSNVIVKFSIDDGSVDAFMSTRAKSESGPAYLVPHSPVFLLMTNFQPSALGNGEQRVAASRNFGAADGDI